MARLSDSITYGNHAITGDATVGGALTVAGTAVVPVNLTAGANVNVAGSYPNFTISATDTDTNTTYTAGTGITLAGTTFSLTGDSFSSTGTYAGLRAQATTKADVGLSLIPNATTTSAATANAIMRRDGNADVFCRLFRSTYAVTNPTIAGIYTTQTIGGDYMRPSTPAQVKTALSIAAGDVSGLSDAATTTVATIRAGTTAANVGLGNVRNVSSYSQSEANANFLGTTAKAADSNLLDGLNSTAFLLTTGKAADSNLLDGINSTAFLRSNATDVASGRLTFSHPDGLECPNGISGGYGQTNGSGSDWAATIWAMGNAYDGSGTGASFVPGNYHLAWQRSASSGYNSGIGEGIYVYSQNALRGGIGTGGVWSSGNVTAYSDIRLKKNIQVIPDALAKVKQLSGYTFDRVDVEGLRQTGVIAQELMDVLPEAVNGGPTEKDLDAPYSVAYGNIVGLLIEAIKEQQQQIDDLTKTSRD